MAEITLDPRGPAGANGLNWYTEERNPLPADGRDNESWLNTRTLTVFKKEAGVWNAKASIAPSPPKPGTPGAAGNTIYSDEGPPSTQLGRSGDFYLQKSGSVGLVIYGPKAGSTWPPGVGLVTLIVGGAPPVSSTGVDGQSYIDTVNGVLYPPKVNGAWPAGTYLRGLIVGSGPPSASVGVDGTTYLDTMGVALYGPKAGGIWPGSPTSLIGPKAFKPVAPWASGTAYSPGPPADLVQVNGSSYACLIAHTAGSSFATDLAAGRWGLVAAKGVDGTGTGTVKHSGTPAVGRLARFSDTTGDLIEDAGVSSSDILSRGQIVGLSYGPDALA